MDNSQTNQLPTQGVEYWTNEVEYLRNSMDGLKLSYSLISSLHAHALKQLESFSPEREEVTE